MANVNNADRIRLILLAFFLKMISGAVLSQIPSPPARLILDVKTPERLNPELAGMYSGPVQLKKSVFRSIRKLNDEGYPFASFHFDSLSFAKDAALLSGRLESGPKVLNGPVQVHGDSSFREDLISRWAGFRKDEPYSLTVSGRIPARLRAMPFAVSWREPELEWFGNQAILHAYLWKNPAGSLNGVIGLLPGQGSDRRLLLTGNAEAGFANLFNRGIAFQLRWSRFALSSQQAVLALDWPFLTRNGLGVSGNFELFRQDSMYFNRRAGAEMLFNVAGIWCFRIGIQSQVASQRTGFRMPAINQQVQSMLFGLDMETESVNRISPGRKALRLRVLPGIKVREESREKKQYYQLEMRGRFQTALWSNRKNFWLRANGDFGLIRSGALLLADQFRMGGLRTFRGFNENQFFTTAHLLLGLQPSWLLDSGFMVSAFSEGMFFQTDPSGPDFSKMKGAVGFGLAAEFEAGKNLIQISLANGWMRGLPLDFRSSKIHFGYIALF